MKILLDSHTFLWAAAEPARLSPRVQAALCEANNDLFLSVASCWEIAIKVQLGKLQLRLSVEQLIADAESAARLRLVPIAMPVALAAARLPWHHRDPFDRLLVAQAQAEDMALATADERLGAYSVRILW